MALASSPPDGGPPGSTELDGRPGRFIQLTTAELSLALLVPRPECSEYSVSAECRGIRWRGWGTAPRRLLAVQREGGRLSLEEFGESLVYRNGPYRLAALADDEVLLLRPGVAGAVVGEVLRFGNGEAHFRAFLLTRRAGCGPANLAPGFREPALGRQVTFPLDDRCGSFEQTFAW